MRYVPDIPARWAVARLVRGLDRYVGRLALRCPPAGGDKDAKRHEQTASASPDRLSSRGMASMRHTEALGDSGPGGCPKPRQKPTRQRPVAWGGSFPSDGIGCLVHV